MALKFYDKNGNSVYPETIADYVYCGNENTPLLAVLVGQKTKEGGEIFNNIGDGTGRWNVATGKNSHAQNIGCQATGDNSHAGGCQSVAYGYCGFAQGFLNKAGENAAALCGYSEARERYSFAAGSQCIANGMASTAVGQNSVTNNLGEFACGKFNKSSTDTIFSCGIGSPNDSQNAFEVLDGGLMFIYGIGGYDGTNPSNAISIQSILTAESFTDVISTLNYQFGASELIIGPKVYNSQAHGFMFRTAGGYICPKSGPIPPEIGKMYRCGNRLFIGCADGLFEFKQNIE